MIKNIQQIKECPDCASSNIVHNDEREEVICRECGLIFEPLAPQMEEAFEHSHKMARSAKKVKKAVKARKAKPRKKKR